MPHGYLRYRLCKLFGLAPSQLDDEPADELLQGLWFESELDRLTAEKLKDGSGNL